MYCPNCGKPTNENDNFCRFCGTDLRIERVNVEDLEQDENVLMEYVIPEYKGEELVLYDVKKHWMSLFWPAFLSPLFVIYFWTVFLNTHSFFSWVIVFGMLGLIFYPIARYKSDKIVITTKLVHIKSGAIHPIELEIPLQDIKIFDIFQSSMGRMLDYGTLSFCYNSEKYEFPYIDSPEDIQYIVDNPQKAMQEFLAEV